MATGSRSRSAARSTSTRSAERSTTRLSLLLQLSQQMRNNGAELTLRNVSATVERLLEVTGTWSSFGTE